MAPSAKEGQAGPEDGALPTRGTRADQARIAALEAELSNALRENAALRRERERWAAEAQRLSAENARLRHATDARSRRR